MMLLISNDDGLLAPRLSMLEQYLCQIPMGRTFFGVGH